MGTLKINKNSTKVEKIPLCSALAMAVMEQSGIRTMIDRVYPSGTKKLRTGHMAKALLGTMFSEGKRKPLYLVSSYYASSPTDLLFGRDVTPSSLDDGILADRLDEMFTGNLYRLVWDSKERLNRMFSFDPKVYHLDSTNFPFYGVKYEDDTGIAAIPEYSMNSKNKRDDLKQKAVQAICDENGVVCYSKSYDGATSDIEMNRDSLDFLKNEVDTKKSLIIADCKLAVSDIIKTLFDSGFSFITKVPANFSECVKDRIVQSALNGSMDESGRYPGRFYYDTVARVTDDRTGLDRECRFIAYRLPGSEKESEKFLRGQGLRSMTSSLKKLKSRSFFCADDAMAAFRSTLLNGYADAYEADPEVYQDERLIKQSRPPWRVKVSNVRVDEKKMEKAAEDHSICVLITNLGFSTEHSDDLFVKASADDVIDGYLSQYLIEHRFRILKSGMGVAHMYIHTPSRQDVVVAISSIATAISDSIDAVFRQKAAEESAATGKKVKPMTMKHIRDFMCSAELVYDRNDDSLSVIGYEGSAEKFFEILDELGIDPKYLISC